MNELARIYATASEQFPLATLLMVGGILIALLGLALCRAAARSSAGQRHVILAATLLGLVLLPLARLSLPALRLELLPPEPHRSGEVVRWSQPDSRPIQSPAAEARIESGMTVVPPESADTGQLPSPSVMLRSLYVAGIAIVLLPLVVGNLRMKWLVRTARPMENEGELIARLEPDIRNLPVAILISESIRVPIAWGWSRSIVLLPAEAGKWPDAMRRDAIVHELAHLDRHDLFFQTIGRVAVALHWFNPLAWRVLNRLLLEAEQACDDRVLESGTETSDYAERLLKIAAGADHSSLRRISAVAMARSSQLATRIESLLEGHRIRSGRPSRIRTSVTFASILAPVLFIGAVRIDGKPQAPRFQEHAAAMDVSTSSPSWARVGRTEVRFEPGVTVRVSGSGSIVLRDGRRTAAPDGDGTMFVDGRLVDGEPLAVGEGERIEIRGPEQEDHWLIEQASPPDRSGRGIRIRDNDPTAESRIDSAEPTTFLLTLDPSGETELFQLSGDSNHGRDLDEVGEEWERNVDRDEGLMEAIYESVGDAIDEDLDWNDVLDADESPLYVAIRSGDVALVRYLLDGGADPNARWEGDGNPLIIAVRHGRRDIIDLLLARGARPDEGVGGDGNALIVAAERGDVWSLERFIASGADLDRGVEGDGNALIAASGNGALAAMKLLIAHGADVEAVVPGDENPLIKASEQGELEAVKLLVSAGADVNARVTVHTWRGETEIRTPLSMAERRGHHEVARFLRSVGAGE